METSDQLVLLWALGFKWTFIVGVIGFFAFTLYRYTEAVKHYIENGDLQDADHSWFFTKRWMFAGEDISEYHLDDYFKNNPWAATADMLFAVFFAFLGAIGWPVTLLIGGVIGYAKWARIRFRMKKEFIEKLAGEHT